MSHIRVTRGKTNVTAGKRLAHYGRVEAVGDDGAVVDVSDGVALTEIILRPGEVEKVQITFLAFEVEDA